MNGWLGFGMNIEGAPIDTTLAPISLINVRHLGGVAATLKRALFNIRLLGFPLFLLPFSVAFPHIIVLMCPASGECSHENAHS